MNFAEIEFPIKVLYQRIDIHKINYPYEFTNKDRKVVYGIVTYCNIEINKYNRILVYNVEMEDGDVVLVDHETNRQI